MIKIFILLISALLFTGCEQAHQSIDGGLDSLRVIKTDLETPKIFYVPAKAVLNGPGNQSDPLILKAGNQRIFQAMLVVAADEKDIKSLEKRARENFGDNITLAPFRGGSFKINIAYRGKTIIDTETIATNVNLPVQLTAKKGDSIELDVNLSFEPYMAARQKTKTISTYTYKKSINDSGKSAAASTSAQIEVGNQKLTGFKIKQKFSY